MSDCHGSAVELAQVRPSGTRKTVAIVGPPNAGKSTLFNLLTGLRQKVANFPGVTVEHRVGSMKLRDGREVDLLDLPGVYSLEPRSEDERITRDALLGKLPGVSRPDAVLLILDSTNLGRHLMLAAPVLSAGIPTLVVLNMADDLEKRGGSVDAEALANQLGAPVALISAAKNEGVDAVRNYLSGQFAVPKPVELPVLQDVPKCRQWSAKVGNQARYQPPAPPVWTRRLDSVFLHPIAGPAIFFFVAVLVFQTIFTVAQPLMDATERGVSTSAAWIGETMPETWWRDLLVEGVWGGVGSVVVFLPQILILFLFIGILEDSGYLARAALIADRTMARIGLQGKSFIPLLSAYACAVPAIMATRTIENARDRIATILIAPFMTCSARLPVYTLIIAAFIPERPVLGSFLGSRAAAMLGLYVLGFLAALVTARLLKSSILKSDRMPFMLEMPPYRWPTVRSLGLRLYDRAMAFLKRAGTVILAVSIGLWVLAHLPLKDGRPPKIEDSLAGTFGRTVEPLIEPLGFNWKIGIGLLTSLAAREVIIGTLGTIYGIEGAGEEGSPEQSVGLQQALQRDLTPGAAVALLIFFAFAMQCLSTLAVVRRETGGWKWPAAQFAYMTVLAYFGALVVNQAAIRGLF
ncbi:MAG: ferrous iron transport protein B [Bryobacteraceae bacterium]|nr:ferrous iron transport protein B [Bryobacteraceae bacterium]MDW8380303.1 ferrous iron transport protein B [Bryobacterales bacterium]